MWLTVPSGKCKRVSYDNVPAMTWKDLDANWLLRARRCISVGQARPALQELSWRLGRSPCAAVAGRASLGASS